MARWRNRPEPELVPPAVLSEWVSGDPDGLADAWLDGLYDQDPLRWYEAFIVFISTPTYTLP